MILVEGSSDPRQLAVFEGVHASVLCVSVYLCVLCECPCVSLHLLCECACVSLHLLCECACVSLHLLCECPCVSLCVVRVSVCVSTFLSVLCECACVSTFLFRLTTVYWDCELQAKCSCLWKRLPTLESSFLCHFLDPICSYLSHSLRIVLLIVSIHLNFCLHFFLYLFAASVYTVVWCICIFVRNYFNLNESCGETPL